MKYDEFINAIVNSSPVHWEYDDSVCRYIFKPDLAISIVGKEMDFGENGKFYEDWATDFTDPNARKKEFALCYMGNEIETFYTASVDGHRMYIPYPDLQTMHITYMQYAIGNIVNIPNASYGYDGYLARAGITVD